MRGPAGWVWLALAAVLAGVAVYAGPNQTAAIGFAAGAFAAVALYLAGLAHRDSWGTRGHPPGPTAEPRSPFRVSLAAGRSGRSEVVVLLDELDRRYAHPLRPTTPAEELARLRGETRAQFRAYVSSRLDEIEGGST